MAALSVSPALQHFLELVQSGRFEGASSGARGARILARAALDAMPVLGSQAVQGLAEFLVVCKTAPTTARDLAQLWNTDDDETLDDIQPVKL